MTIIYFILILSTVIFIHEFGHFLFAKKNGVYVYEFSLGMGPQIFKFHRKNDETMYSIRLFPIGGYVQMAGEVESDDKDIPQEKNLNSKKWHQKFLVVVAGILFNFLLAIVLFFIIGIFNGCPKNTPVLSGIVENGAAYEAGIRDNDLVLKINNKKISTLDRFLLEMQVYNGKTITLTVKDENNSEKKVTIKPEEIKDEKGNVSYKYGFGVKNEVEKGFLYAIKYAFTKFGSLIWQMLLIIFYLFTGKLSLSSLSGPIGIFTVVSDTAKQGFLNIIYLTGYISLNLGFMNFLPIPALDGGRLFFLIIEKIKGSPVNPKTENIIHTVGFMLLMALIVVISFNDILRIVR